MMMYITAKDRDRPLTQDTKVDISPEPKYNALGRIHTDQGCQKIMGFGGALTEAAAVTLSKMSPGKRAEVLRGYYDIERGNAYNLGRLHIHSCDFALGNYTYLQEGDASLDSFNIDHDRELILPLIKDTMEVRGSALTLLASPWSPPGWMKDTGEMNHGGKLLPIYREAWAAYYTKFIEAYEDAGIPIWGITVQNEPAALQIWDSCLYTGEEERDFIKDHLGPTMVKAGYSDKKILIWDHNRDLIIERAEAVLSDPEAAKYVWGTGFHWYVSEAFENVGQVHQRYPDKHLLFTEGCQEGGVHIGSWETGERYGRNMIGDFNNWCEGYLDWNIVLDETGGPNHVGNLCDAPIICDTIRDEIIYNSSYYYIGHFSRFIKSGAIRLVSSLSMPGLSMAAFQNPDGQVVTVIMNENQDCCKVSLELEGGYMNLVLEGHSIQTILND